MYRFYTVLILLMLIHPGYSAGEDHLCSGCSRFVPEGLVTFVRDSALLSYDVNHYGIALQVNDTTTYIKGYTDITATALRPVEELVFELSSLLEVDSVCLGNERILSWKHESDLIRFSPASPIGRGQVFTARIYYGGTGGQGGFYAGISNRRDTRWEQRVTYTLSEPFRSKDWFACKQVLPDKADSADIYLIVDEGLMAGSNGILTGIDSLPGKRLGFHWKSRYPVAYYLLSLSVSAYQDYSFYSMLESGDDSILVQNYVYDHPDYLVINKAQIDETDGLLRLYSKMFSLYPFPDEKYGHCLAPMGGGMEHQTMTTLSSFRFTLVAHELTHQWFGDNVTCANWQDIWVNEGFASYGEYLALESLYSRSEADLWMDQAHEWAFTEPSGSVYIPEEDATDVFRIFSRSLSYKKGAALLHMIRYELADDSLFFHVLRQFQEQFADSVATGTDFRDVLSQVSGSDFGWFFRQWYFGEGYPFFDFTWWQSSDSVIIEISQTGSSAGTPFFRTDLDLNLLFEQGGDTLVRITVDRPAMRIAVKVDKIVKGLLPDPGNWILDKSEVKRRTFQEAYFSVSPNPFSDRLNIIFSSGPGQRRVILSNMAGKILETHTSTGRMLTLNTRRLRQGIYLLQVEDGRDNYSARVVKQ